LPKTEIDRKVSKTTEKYRKNTENDGKITDNSKLLKTNLTQSLTLNLTLTLTLTLNPKLLILNRIKLVRVMVRVWVRDSLR